MMYSFGARTDFAVWDEPFYAAFLAATGIDHPMRDAILQSGEVSAARVAERCLGAIPDGKPHLYMKHMPHHMQPDFPLGWATACVNIHLIRHPVRVVASYAAKRDSATLEDLGFGQQVSLFDALGGIVIDSADVRSDPARALRALCATIGLSFDPAMLNWPAGGHASDGVWAAHWYGAVHRSTGFAGPEGPLPQLDGDAARLAEAAMPHYTYMKSRALSY